MSNIEFISESAERTKRFAADMAKKAVSGDVICLYGDLGAGKTAFVQGFAKGMGADEYVTSPTFTIINIYESGRLPIYHFDVYRISDADEMYEIGYDEYVYGDGVCIIEWPQLIEDILPRKRMNIYIEKDAEKGDGFRKIKAETL